MTPRERRRVWEDFVVLSDTVRREVARELHAESGLSDADFTVMAHLASTPGSAGRSTRCAEAIGWGTDRLSHQVRRLEGRGLVRRERAGGGDGRASVVVLTDPGRTAYRKALGPHIASAQRWFLDAFDDDGLAELGSTLRRALDHVRATGVEDPRR